MGGMFPCRAGPVGTMTYKEGTKGPLRGGPWSEADLSVGNDDDTQAQMSTQRCSSTSRHRPAHPLSPVASQARRSTQTHSPTPPSPNF